MNTPILFVDGVCHLCHGSVQFILKYERRSQLKFAHLQSTFSKQTLEKYHKSTESLDTVCFLDEKKGKVYTKSSAVVQVLWLMGGIWQVVSIFLWCVPLPVRNCCYSIVVKYRYRWFGKYKTCFIPPSNDRFIK